MKSDCGISVIAEVGCNHKGDMEIACRMIEIAARECGADVVKFQKRDNKTLLSESVYNSPHPVPKNSYGRTYGEHREFLEFSAGQHRELQEECRRHGVEYSTSVWDLVSASEIVALKPAMIKVPSATNQNFDVQEFVCREFEGEIHVSTGMTTRVELDALISFYEGLGRAKDLVVYACTSGYPVPPEDVCLLEINHLQERYGDRVGAIGFSGHHLGIAIDVAATALGVAGAERYGQGRLSYIERHFTLERTWKGTDHSASLEPQELRQLCSDIKTVGSALTYKPMDILDIEVPQRHKLKWREGTQASQSKKLLNKVS
ncbi:N-acetylneuraminate synthase [Roseibium polysiphoniae]|uniref:N-acetylneuraminate synthase n=1 Tax=Roseibium polysiphoniae TaxID=2571221 RepID=A0A944GRF1_9HYPH|nr:N-acetylneuraminate synthase family protein [Roseibium polysiphoniae]MBS8259074.1 N-acetylneuraminate synthase [Roseibium polysiphoniae]